MCVAIGTVVDERSDSFGNESVAVAPARGNAGCVRSPAPATPTQRRPGQPRRAWAVVTGASSGLGREFALSLAARGYPVLAVARRGERLTVLANEVARNSGRLEPFVADLSTSDGVGALLSTAGERDVDLLVNNAGVAAYGPFASTPPEVEQGLLRLNLEAVVALTHGLLPPIRHFGPTSAARR